MQAMSALSALSAVAISISQAAVVFVPPRLDFSRAPNSAYLGAC
jgi:hypothetical protein